MNLTFDVKNKSIVKPIRNLLTSCVMPEVSFSSDVRKEFGKWMQTERENAECRKTTGRRNAG